MGPKPFVRSGRCFLLPRLRSGVPRLSPAPTVARVGPPAAVLAGGRAAAAGHRSALRAIATAPLLPVATPAAAHPLDAPSGLEIEAAVASPRADDRLGQDGRTASITHAR